MSKDSLSFLDQAIKKEFESNRRLLSLDEYLHLLAEKPEQQLRSSAAYIADMMDHFGKDPVPNQDKDQVSHAPYRFKVFNHPKESGVRRVIGQEYVQNQIYRALRNFGRQGLNNKLLLLHGPNGSAKTSIIHALMSGMEQYSREPEGAVYTFNWIFPVEKITKPGLGLGSYSAPRDSISSFAKLPDEEVQSRLPCDLKDHPILLIPVESRRAYFEKLLGAQRTEEIWDSLPQYFTRGELCHRCKQVYEALLVANGGDFKKVLMHVQVERFFYSRRYRSGLVTIEPQLHVDAQYQQLSMGKGLSSLPSSLHAMSLFSLSGDLVESNRGIVEFSDLLKRPVDSFKYLLSVCESGSVNVGMSIAYLDSVLLGSTNEIQLDAFKEFPDFMSFKARIELIRVPYLLSVSDEKQIYDIDVEHISEEKHVAPHVSWALGLWAVLTRLKKPNSINYPPSVSALISNLSPIEKARLYDTGEMPVSLGPEERKMLRSSIRKLREEYTNIPYYEGRMGASAREMKSIVFDAAQNPEFPCLSPLAVFREMEDFVKRVSEYEFLKQDVKDGYHDSNEFINTVRTEYLGLIDREVRDSIGLYNSAQWEDFLKRYVQHVSLVLKKEKIKNPITGKIEDPDMPLIEEFEKIVAAPPEGTERDGFRQNIISQVGAWALDHPGETVLYQKVFPQFWQRLEKHYYDSQKATLTKMHNALLVYGKGEKVDVNEEGGRLAAQTVKNMKSRLGYCDHCAQEVITFLMRQKY